MSRLQTDHQPQGSWQPNAGLHLNPRISRSANCNVHLGRKYMATVPQLDSIRGLYTLDIESLESYQIGNASVCLLWESIALSQLFDADLCLSVPLRIAHHMVSCIYIARSMALIKWMWRIHTLTCRNACELFWRASAWVSHGCSGRGQQNFTEWNCWTREAFR